MISSEVAKSQEDLSELLELNLKLLSGSHSDVIFVLKNDSGRKIEVSAHKAILATKCEYFHAMFYSSGLSESSNDKIELKNVSLKSFQFVLKFIYTGMINFDNLTVARILEILDLAELYMLKTLKSAIEDHLKNSPNLSKNVCCYLNASFIYNLKSLQQKCLEIIDENSEEIIKDESFKILTKHALVGVISRSEFYADEFVIFQAVKMWIEHQEPELNREEIAEVLTHVRFPLMCLEDLMCFVGPSQLMTSDEFLNILSLRASQQESSNSSQNLERKVKIFTPEKFVNVATTSNGAKLVEGIQVGDLNILDDLEHEHDATRGFFRPANDEKPRIVVALSKAYRLNHIKMKFQNLNGDEDSFSYLVSVSVNKKNWTRVENFERLVYKSMLYLKFDEKPVKFIKIFESSCKMFELVSLEASRLGKEIKIEVPTENVGSVKMGATLLPGYKDSDPSEPQAIIKEKGTSNLENFSPYTYCKIGSNITIKLAQPYMIDSLRLRFLQDYAYKFYIETSTDQINWTMALDARNGDFLGGWQKCSFEPRLVTFIRITGTSSNNQKFPDFYVVHFKCPSQNCSCTVC